jgi:hypothetical protein
LFGAMGTALLAGAVWHWALVMTSATIALTAAGGFMMIKKLVVMPLLASTWYLTKAPEWFKAAMTVVTWLFNKPDATAEAQAAGAAALKAAPSPGVVAVVGKPSDVA